MEKVQKGQLHGVLSKKSNNFWGGFQGKMPTFVFHLSKCATIGRKKKGDSMFGPSDKVDEEVKGSLIEAHIFARGGKTEIVEYVKGPKGIIFRKGG